MSSRSTIIRIAGVLVLFAVLLPTTADVDLWGHVLFGRDIVTDMEISRTDPYSFTSDREWINHEWLSEVVMYLAYRWGGGAGLVALRLLVIAAIGLLVARAIRLDGLSDARGYILVALAVILTIPRTQHVRPQLFSVACFAALLFILKQFEHGNRRALIAAPVLVAAWANLHGGWIVGCAVLLLWSGVQLVRGDAARQARLTVVAVGISAVLASLLNPYGVHLWTFLWRTVGLGRSDISEWSSISTAMPGVIALWATTAALALVGVFRSASQRQLGDLVIVAALGILSFRVQRLDAFFALAVIMLLKPAIGAARPAASTADSRRGGLAFVGVCLAALGVGAFAFSTAGRPGCVDMDRAQFLPEPEAVQFIRDHGLQGRMLTFFDWGEYAIWHLAPGILVSMDGRRETVYSAAETDRHLRIYDGLAEQAEIAALRADLAWLPAASPAVNQLKTLGWQVVFSGPWSVILSRDSVDTPASILEASASSRRCFPGP
jgi:hypothetical protein